MFTEGQTRFQEVEGVAQGLGPRFNSTSCSSCHSQPAVGGTSQANNPEVGVAPPGQLTTAVSSFITANGPAREARFVQNLATGQPDGGVHDLFTIVGRADNPRGCSIIQPDFATNLANNNVIFRIPTPTFGGGLIEAITDTTIKANLAANASAKVAVGISGHVNTDGDGTVTRFGWKAQTKSLQLFSGAAYNVEMGVTNQIFQNEREENSQCAINGTPEDQTNFDSNQPIRAMSDVLGFSLFMRFLAPPTPVTSYGNVTANSISNGSAKFSSVGCALCHTPSLRPACRLSPLLTSNP